MSLVCCYYHKVSKDSINRWCRDITLSPVQIERLRNRKLKGAEKGRIIGAQRQKENRIKLTRQIVDQAQKEVGILSIRDIFIAGISLYLGEGFKQDRQVGFSNTDPKIIEFMMVWFRKFCRVPEDKFHGQVWIHDNLDELKARKFWSSLTKIPLDQFNRSYIAKNKIDSPKIRKNIHNYGVFSIRVYNAAIQRRIIGWMAGILS